MKATPAKQEKKRIAQPLAPEIIARIIELKDQKKSDRAVAEELGISIPSVPKHYKRALAARAVESQPTSEAEEPTPTTYPPVGIVPPRRRAETRTDFSQVADERTDIARKMLADNAIEHLITPRESALDVALKLDELGKRQREPAEAALDAQSHEISQLKQMLAQAQVSQVQAQSRLDIAEVNASVKLMQSELRNEMERLRMEQGAYERKITAWIDVSKALPEVISKTVTETVRGLRETGVQPGQFLHGARAVGQAVAARSDISFGGHGIVTESPISVGEVVQVARHSKAITAGRAEPIEDAELGRYEKAAQEILSEEDQSEPRSDDRTERLARRVAELAREGAELRVENERLRHGVKDSLPQPTEQSRRVVAVHAGEPVEPNPDAKKEG